jgi:hypothetical protein
LALGVVAVVGLVLVALAGYRGPKVSVALAGATVTGLSLRAFELLVVPIDPRRADMVPLVILATRTLARGEAPYRVYRMPWDVPLTYLPLSWLAYAPAYLGGIDPRWTNAVAEVSVLGAIFFAARTRADKTLRDAAALLWATWFVSHSLIAFDAQIAAPVQWAALAWLLALSLETSRWTPVAAGVAMATTLLTVPLLPTLAIAWHRGRYHPGAARARRRRRRPLVQAAAIATGVAAILVVPWVLASPTGFVRGVVLWFNDLDGFPRDKWLENRAWASYPGLGGLFWTWGLQHLLKPLQLVVIALLALRFSRRLAGSRIRDVIGPATVAALMLFLLFNPVVWGYLWETVVALTLVTLAGAAPRRG